MKKKYLKLVACLALVAAITTGLTLAYLSVNTGTVTNTFTSEQKITGTTTEPKWTEKHPDSTWKDYLPGEMTEKDPQVTINAGSARANVGLKVSFFVENEQVTYSEFAADYADVYTGTSKEAAVEGFSTAWTKVAASEMKDTKDLFFVYNDVVDATTAAKTTSTLFDFVKVDSDLKTTPSFKIVITGYAVQADNLTGTTATAELVKLAELNK